MPVKDPIAETIKGVKAATTEESAAAAAAAANNIDDDDDDNTSGAARAFTRWNYEPCLWIFFGRNNPCTSSGSNNDDDDNDNLQGRPEHTDQISHDGTWHYQLSGTKRWLLRPTPQLLRKWNHQADDPNDDNNDDDNNGEDEEEQQQQQISNQQLRIDCRQGDVLVLNTRLWRHQTILPPQPEPSVSYARDFWINTNDSDDNNNINNNNGTSGATAVGNMTNVDGLYATDDIREDTIVFREDNMPDCELHRCSSPGKANCRVVELEDGMQAVVSSRFIGAGEFFCIPESSGEEESWGEAEDDDDDDDEGFLCQPC